MSAVKRIGMGFSLVPFLEYGEHIPGIAVVVLPLFLVNKARSGGRYDRRLQFDA